VRTLLFALLLVAVPAARANDERPRVAALEQRLNQQVPADLSFRDDTGKAVRLGDYFGERPVFLVLAYYKCPRLCTLVLNGLLDTLKALPYDAGKDFQIVVVSIDPREGPELAAEKKAAYVERYGRPGGDAGWHFLTGEAANIESLADVVGFRYFYDAERDLYAHASGVMLLTPDGKLSRYFYGLSYPLRDVRLSLVDASAGKVGSPVEQLILLCFSYDPATGRYAVAAMKVVRLAGAVFVVALGTFLVWSWRRERKQPATVPPTPGRAGDHV
jgi:protein SCO1